MQKISWNTRKKIIHYLWCKKNIWKNEEKLWNIVHTYKNILWIIPWIWCICICNSLAMNNCHEQSDIDLFVITKKNRLWTARIFLTIITTLLKIRKNSKKHKEMFCLSFFVSKEENNFLDIAIKDDIYLAYWIETLIPIVNKNNVFEEFIINNKLTNMHSIKKFSWKWKKQDRLYIIKKLIAWWCMKLWDLQEFFFKKIFLPKTIKKFYALWKPFWVIIRDTMLKFHNKDKRKEIRNAII